MRQGVFGAAGMSNAPACFVVDIGLAHDVLQVRAWFWHCTEDDAAVAQGLFDHKVYESSRGYAEFGGELLEVVLGRLVGFDAEQCSGHAYIVCVMYGLSMTAGGKDQRATDQVINKLSTINSSTNGQLTTTNYDLPSTIYRCAICRVGCGLKDGRGRPIIGLLQSRGMRE